jgi:hypothetical protein
MAGASASAVPGNAAATTNTWSATEHHAEGHEGGLRIRRRRIAPQHVVADTCRIEPLTAGQVDARHALQRGRIGHGALMHGATERAELGRHHAALALERDHVREEHVEQRRNVHDVVEHKARPAHGRVDDDGARVAVRVRLGQRERGQATGREQSRDERARRGGAEVADGQGTQQVGATRQLGDRGSS